MKPLVSNVSWPDSQWAAGNQVFGVFKNQSQFSEKNDCQDEAVMKTFTPTVHSVSSLLLQKKFNLTPSYIWKSEQPLVAPHHHSFGRNATIASLAVPVTNFNVEICHAVIHACIYRGWTMKLKHLVLQHNHLLVWWGPHFAAPIHLGNDR